MRQTLASFVAGFDNSAFRLPYVYGVLECGHSCHVPVVGTLYACAGCGVERRGDLTPCACGHHGYRVVTLSNPHDPAQRLMNVGEVVECADCDRFAVALVMLAEIAPTLHHTRADRRGQRIIHCYRHDPTSPSGFFLAMSIEDRPEVDTILRGGLSPLSPTERA